MFKSDITVNNAHLIATEIERTIKLKLKEIEVVSIHLEPEF
jgi:divalent metal cation (Fe/Co/Zn/Cd) transporter